MNFNCFINREPFLEHSVLKLLIELAGKMDEQTAAKRRKEKKKKKSTKMRVPGIKPGSAASTEDFVGQ
jgi:hypothetical protein